MFNIAPSITNPLFAVTINQHAHIARNLKPVNVRLERLLYANGINGKGDSG